MLLLFQKTFYCTPTGNRTQTKALEVLYAFLYITGAIIVESTRIELVPPDLHSGMSYRLHHNSKYSGVDLNHRPRTYKVRRLTAGLPEHKFHSYLSHISGPSDESINFCLLLHSSNELFFPLKNVSLLIFTIVYKFKLGFNVTIYFVICNFPL